MLLVARNLSLKVIRNLYQPSINDLVTKINANQISAKYEKALENFNGRILFNSILEIQTVRFKKYDQIVERKERKTRAILQRQIKPLPLVLNQLCEGAVSNLEQQDESDTEQLNIQDLPYSRYMKVLDNNEEIKVDKDERLPKNWLKDYELYDETEEEIESKYGTPDPNVPVSDVPCSGCGALLHCKESSIPGYVPSELFSGLSHNELKTIRCQRCHFLVNYNTAINVTVTAEDYVNIISTIKDKYALAIVLVDLLDFPCSIFNGLKDLLGSNRPVFIVGNKVDLLPRDQPDYLNHIKQCLKAEAMKMGFEDKYIKYISLISAKTGYGIEELITKLHSIWNYRGDVYLVGCTNVGKSSLFNALLKSDYCKVEASDLVQRATACPWPGTTLRMLKFPILKTSDFRIAIRTKRLVAQQKSKFEEQKLRREQATSTKKIEHATLIGHIGMTFEKEKEEVNDPASLSHESGFSANLFTLNEKNEKYAQSKWCYDTPGVIQHDQARNLILNLNLLLKPFSVLDSSSFDHRRDHQSDSKGNDSTSCLLDEAWHVFVPRRSRSN